MRTIRIYTPQELEAGSSITLEPAASQHLIQVLRLKPGSHFSLFNGNGFDFNTTLLEANKRACKVEISNPGEKEDSNGLKITLALGISKGERMDFAIQKSVELGVSTIVPVITQRSVVRLDKERQQKKVDHWKKIAINACEQSGRRRLAEVTSIQPVSEWLSRDAEDTLKLLLHTQNELPITCVDAPSPSQGIALLIGPEGGLADSEVQQALDSDYKPIRLGPRILRTETAPLAAIAAIQTLWGDFRDWPR